MSIKELKLDGGLTTMRVNDVASIDGSYVGFIIEQKAARGTKMSMLAMLDRGQQHLLMLYLQERLRSHQ